MSATVLMVRTSEAVAAIDRELHVDRPGWVVTHVRPETNLGAKSLYMDVLDSLGLDVSPNSNHGRTELATARMLLSWLSAGTIDNLAVASANYLPTNLLLDLYATVLTAGVRLWLLYDVDPSVDRMKALKGLEPTTIRATEFLRLRSESATLSGPEPEAEPFPPIPQVHFLGFLEEARRALRPRSFALVRQRYQDGLREMTRRLGTADKTHESVVTHLHEMTAQIRDANELSAVVKGAQIGAFSQGVNLGVDLVRFGHRAHLNALPLHLNAAEWGVIHRVRRPWEAAVCVLTALGLDARQLGSLGAGDVALDGSTVSVPGQTLAVPDEGRPILATQHVYRLLRPGDGPYFLYRGLEETELDGHWVGVLLQALTRSTGLTLRIKSAQTQGRGADWTRRVGVTVSAL